MAHAHQASLAWTTSATPVDFLAGRYSRAHTWAFDGGLTLPASPSPHVVPRPWADPANVDPEEAFVASIASCHMLTFLYLASKAGFVVVEYADDAIGEMAKNARGVPWVAKVTLSPTIRYGERAPNAEEARALHHAAHDECYIAQSVKTEIVVADPGD